MKHIQKIKLKNFRRFKSFEVTFDKTLNMLIGDNEAGKSSILNAIDLVLSASRSKTETIGLESLFNHEVVEEFLNSSKRYKDLPELFIEIYLSEQNNPDLNGKNNSDNIICDGLFMKCSPIDELSKEIKEILSQEEPCFPFEYYSITFKTFSDQSVTGYSKFLKHISIDNAHISNEYATREYIKNMYSSYALDTEKNKHKNEYRKHKEAFKRSALTDLNSRFDGYAFGIRNNSKANLETDLTLTEADINIENKGKGRQCFIKTEFALNRSSGKIDVILLEEPENHLSHVNMKKIVGKILDAGEKQLFITTHNSLISSRLDLRKAILINSNSTNVSRLNFLSEDTAKFFMKAPDNNVNEFILSKKVILVEGDAEFILLESFFKKVTTRDPHYFDIHIISIGGTSFKRYLELAKTLNVKTAVIRDNDGDYQKNCVERYSEYASDLIKIFGDSDNNRSTFEICLYLENQTLCEELFAVSRRTLSVQDYMLHNKADVAFDLLDKKESSLHVPQYIKNAIEWIKQ